jgi:hypothetical protein
MHFAPPKTGPLDGKEKGDEKQFFNKEDEKLLKGLLKKVQNQAKASEQTPEEVEKSQAALKKLFKDNKIEESANQTFFNALLEWKKQI